MEAFNKWIEYVHEVLHLPAFTPKEDGSIELTVNDKHTVILKPMPPHQLRFFTTWDGAHAENWTEGEWEAILEAQVGFFLDSSSALAWDGERKVFMVHQTLSFEEWDAAGLFQQLELFVNQVEFWHGLTDKKSNSFAMDPFDSIRP
jgi:hypothetical protein